jgi:Ion channel
MPGVITIAPHSRCDPCLSKHRDHLRISVLFCDAHGARRVLWPRALRDNLTNASDLIYFSFVTLTSVDYGDIIPVHPVARSLANVEAIIGQFYPATLLARLVTLQLEGRHGAT